MLLDLARAATPEAALQAGATHLVIGRPITAAADPRAAAELSAMAQGVGYCVAALGPFLVGVVHEVSGGWGLPAALYAGLCLAAAGFGWWQVCPLGPTGFGDSPYQALSVFAGNPYLLDLADLEARGLLSPAEREQLALALRVLLVLGVTLRGEQVTMVSVAGAAICLLGAAILRDPAMIAAWLPRRLVGVGTRV